MRNLAFSLLFHAAIFAAVFWLPAQPGRFQQVAWVDLLTTTDSAVAAPPQIVRERPAAPETDESPIMDEPDSEEVLQDATESAAETDPQQATTLPGTLPLFTSAGMFKSFREGVTLRSDVREYYLALLAKVNEHWRLAGREISTDYAPDEMMISVFVGRKGEILGLRLIKSSGSEAHDRLILNAIQSASPLPPLPETFGYSYFEAPIRLTPPSAFSLS